MNRWLLIISSIVFILFTAGILPVGIVTAAVIDPTGNLTAIWANDGGDKVTKDELRGTNSPDNINNNVWNGSIVEIFGAKNEVVAFNLILEAGTQAAENIAVSFTSLTGPGGAVIATTDSSNLFNWTNRNIELFYVRYLQIKGLSILSYETYDERHIPSRFRRPYDVDGSGSGTWNDRPDHDKYYPDIAVPLELVSQFTVAASSNQSIWVDIYIPKAAPTGSYTGNVTVSAGGTTVATVPVSLTVRNFILPDEPNSKTMVYFSRENINKRYLGDDSLADDNAGAIALRDSHFKVAHRHKISLIDHETAANDRPSNEWLSRLDGTLFTSANGYDGPGVSTGNNIYSIATYGTWQDDWNNNESAMQTHAQAWADWFTANSATTEYFLYLIDESDNYSQIEQWASWINNAPGSGSNLRSLATMDMTSAVNNCASLDISPSWFTTGDTTTWQSAVASFENDTNKRVYFYNGVRPATGSFATEDDGVALRQLVWAQYKKGIDRWFKWESTYYNNYQGDMGETNVFTTARTFGTYSTVDSELGETGWNHSNGDGVLFYPGTDTVYSSESYGISGPIASLRLKHWRRGIQDVDYIVLAAQLDATSTQQIVNNIVPTVLWEYGVDDPSDPTYVSTDISWSIDPDVWETARDQLADIIEQYEQEEEVEVGAGGHCSLGVTSPATTCYLAEGSTKGYATWLCIQNPNDNAADITLTYMDENSNTVIDTETIAANRRFTKRVNGVTGMKNEYGVATKVECTNGYGVITERAMYYSNGGHCSIGVIAPATTSYFAEGSTNGYDTWLCIQNPNVNAANITLTYMDELGNTFQESEIVLAQRRYTRKINDISAMNNKNGVATKVESTNGVGVITERAMYWSSGAAESRAGSRGGSGGHCSISVTAPATTWYFAEGSTNGYDTWICIQNPGTNPVDVTLIYMDELGTTFQESVTIAGQRRYTRKINDVSSMNNKNGVSTQVVTTNGVGVIAERAMYWSTGGHCSVGVTNPATTWYLAEGSTNGYDTWICIQNPGSNPAGVTLTYMDENGATFQESVSIAGQRRYTRKINDVSSMNNKSGVSTKIEATNGVGVVAERAMYWSS